MAGLVDGGTVIWAKNPEVLYPNVFSDICPNGEVPPLPNCWDPSSIITLPITHLSHVTHNLEADSIRKDESLCSFQPMPKIGKDKLRYDSPIGETFIKIGPECYKRVPKPESVFPGYLSWWGVNVMNNQDFQATLSGIRKKKGKRSVFEVDYLANPPSSRYGNNEFIFTFNDLIESYKRSRTDCTSNAVCFRKAGTLRYRFAVCYVVMVVMREDLSNSDIMSMPSIFDEPKLGHNGCIDEEGMLIQPELQLSFNISRPFSWIRDQNGTVAWESLAFAFYFPNNQPFLCPKQADAVVPVEHDPGRCIWPICPNIAR